MDCRIWIRPPGCAGLHPLQHRYSFFTAMRITRFVVEEGCPAFIENAEGHVYERFIAEGVPGIRRRLDMAVHQAKDMDHLRVPHEPVTYEDHVTA